MDLHAALTSVAGHPVLAVSGEIDLATLPTLHNALSQLLRQHDGQVVLIDLDGVYACDDCGLGVLLGAAGRAREAGGDVVLVCTDGPFRDRLARTGLDRAVSVASTVTAAATSLAR